NRSDGAGEILVLGVLVAASVDDDDPTTSPDHHLVETEVVEMAAVGEVHVRRPLARPAQQLTEDRREREPWLGTLPHAAARLAGVRHPPAEASVEECHGEA